MRGYSRHSSDTTKSFRIMSTSWITLLSILLSASISTASNESDSSLVSKGKVTSEDEQFVLSANDLRLMRLFLSSTLSQTREDRRSSVSDVALLTRLRTETIKLPLIEGYDIRFKRLSSSQGLSQVRVSQIIQDNQGFIWFGTQNGLNRYDGYKFKIFKHDAKRPESLSGVYIYSLFKDRTGQIWVGSDEFLDRFDPVTEAFTHYRFELSSSNTLRVKVNHISQDPGGMLWVSTGNGLFRLNPGSGKLTHYGHVPGDVSSLGDDIKSTGEDREGRFWVATSKTLDEFDLGTQKVNRHIPLGDSGFGAFFHEDRLGVFWIVYGLDGLPAIFDRKTDKMTRYEFEPRDRPGKSRNRVYAMIEDHEGNMWFGTEAAGLLKYDREHRRFISYNQRPGDNTSLADTRVTTLFEDSEGSIWVGLHQKEPDFFSTKRPAFERFSHESGKANSLDSSLVGVVYEDRKGVLWVGTEQSLQRIVRKTGQYSTFRQLSGTEVLSILEEGANTLWFGTSDGLKRYDQRSGKLKAYRPIPGNPYSSCSAVIQRLLLDHSANLWAATWDGLCRFDSRRQRFTTYKPDPKLRGLNYYAIAEDRKGNLWLGSNLGLQRFDPTTSRFTVYSHKSDDPGSLSDDRVNSVYFDRSGTLWVGTQNGLDKFDPNTNTFAIYDERQGIAGNVVSCILGDRHGLLWLSTNKGISSFDPLSGAFNNYIEADGLPGPDLTGWGACYENAAGEMFFGGFSGATAFFPARVVDEPFAPPVALTDFRLFGAPVGLNRGSPLKKSINFADAITLSHNQSVFSIEFSALSYVSAATNRYRYVLEGLDRHWNEVGSDQRIASYTTLPAGAYVFRVQAATSRGPWSTPGATLHIEILPPWWNTLWFRMLYGVLLLFGAFGAYYYRFHQIRKQFELRLEASVNERMRIARELHDTLLQSLHGLMFQFQAARNLVHKRPEEAVQTLESAIAGTERAITESQDAIQDIRSEQLTQSDLSELLREMGDELARSLDANRDSPIFRLIVEGERRTLAPFLQDEIYRIAREALRNAFRHASAHQIEAEIRYDLREFRLRIRDDGRGIAREVLVEGKRAGHWGLPGIQERADRIGAKLDVWSDAGAGTEVQLTVPAAVAYETHNRSPFRLFGKASNHGQ